MARFVIILAAVAIVFLGTYMVVRGLGRAVRRVDQGREWDMASDGMVPKLAYGLLIALIVYAVLTATGG